MGCGLFHPYHIMDWPSDAKHTHTPHSSSGVSSVVQAGQRQESTDHGRVLSSHVALFISLIRGIPPVDCL